MKPDEPTPLDADIVALLRVERANVSAPADAQARVLARLGPALGGPGGGSPDGGAGATGRVAGSLARPLSLLVAFLVGGGAGALAWRAAAPPRVVYVERQVPAAVAAGEPSALPSTTEAPADPSASASTEAHRARTADDPGQQLAAERAILDVARTALARGEGQDALAAVAKHERRFPNGALSEEREAIAVQALVLVGQGEQARARAARFHQRFPGSVLTSAVDASIASLR